MELCRQWTELAAGDPSSRFDLHMVTSRLSALFHHVASGRDTIAGVMHQHLAAGLADRRSVSLHSYRDAVTKD
jgi:hypothetical protein